MRGIRSSCCISLKAIMFRTWSWISRHNQIPASKYCGTSQWTPMKTIIIITRRKAALCHKNAQIENEAEQDHSAHTTPDLSFLFRKNLKYTHRHTLNYSHSADDTSLCQTSVFLVNNSLWEKDIAKCNVHIRLLERQEAGEREAGAYYKKGTIPSFDSRWQMTSSQR